MRDFFNEFLMTYVVNTGPTMVKKMIEDKQFLKGESFDSEVDSQMFPNPYLIITLMKIMLKETPEIIY